MSNERRPASICADGDSAVAELRNKGARQTGVADAKTLSSQNEDGAPGAFQACEEP